MRAPRQVQRRSRQLTGEDAAQQAGSAQREHPVPGFVQFCRCPPAMLLQGGSLGFLASGAGDRQCADPDQEKGIDAEEWLLAGPPDAGVQRDDRAQC